LSFHESGNSVGRFVVISFSSPDAGSVTKIRRILTRRLCHNTAPDFASYAVAMLGRACNRVQGATASLAFTATLASYNL
jgi:hypothetical protein